jgi:SAM-dependent methyltransferase
VEYLCAGLGFVRFRDESFDAAFALHCLHHIPDLGARMAEIHRLLRVGGGLAVDDHHQRNDHADRVGAALRQWIDTEIVPRWRAADPRAMEGFPPGGSAHEDVSLGETLRQAQRLFHVRYVDTRYTFLDMLSTAYYLHRDRSPDAFAEAERLVGVLLRAWQAAYPDGAEYVTFVAEKGAGPPAYQPLLQERDLEQPVGEVPVGELVDGVVLRQPFTPRRDHLCAVELQLATYGRVNSGEVVFRVREAGGGPERVVLRVAAADVVNNAWRRFEFPPLSGVRGRRLELTLEAPGARPGDAITAWASLRPRPGLGRCQGAAAGGTLAFRTVCALGVDEVRNPQKSPLQRAAFLYWQGGAAELWPRVRARLGRLAPRGRRP